MKTQFHIRDTMYVGSQASLLLLPLLTLLLKEGNNHARVNQARKRELVQPQDLSHFYCTSILSISSSFLMRICVILYPFVLHAGWSHNFEDKNPKTGNKVVFFLYI